MSDLPIFSAQGKTDSEKLTELIKFMPSLSSAIDRQMSSLDFNNLNESLRNRIENSVTEHQDLSGYSTRSHTSWQAANAEENAKEFAESQAAEAEENARNFAYSQAANAEENAKDYAYLQAANAEAKAKTYTDREINDLREELKSWANGRFATK